MKRARGFTLLELMIVVVVIAILASIALSGYQKQIRKSRRADAKQALAGLALRQEKWRSNHTNYRGTDSSAGDITAFGAMPTSDYYTITVTSTAGASSYTLQAAPTSGSDQTKDSCGTLSWTNTNGTVAKTASGGTTADCW